MRINGAKNITIAKKIQLTFTIGCCLKKRRIFSPSSCDSYSNPTGWIIYECQWLVHIPPSVRTDEDTSDEIFLVADDCADFAAMSVL